MCVCERERERVLEQTIVRESKKEKAVRTSLRLSHEFRSINEVICSSSTGLNFPSSTSLTRMVLLTISQRSRRYLYLS